MPFTVLPRPSLLASLVVAGALLSGLTFGAGATVAALALRRVRLDSR